MLMRCALTDGAFPSYVFKGALRKNGPPWSQTPNSLGYGGEVLQVNVGVYTDGMEGLGKEASWLALFLHTQ